MAAEEVKGMERMLGGRKRQKREVKETRVDRWLSLPHKCTSSPVALNFPFSQKVGPYGIGFFS